MGYMWSLRREHLSVALLSRHPHKKGNIFLSDTGSHRVLKFDSNGNLMAQAGKVSKFGISSGLFNSPLEIALDANENVYVCDQSNHRIVKVTSDLQWVSSFGRKGKCEMEFD